MNAHDDAPRASTNLKICIVSPCYNEADVIGLFYNELKSSLASLPADIEPQVILVDDGSTDATLTRLNELADTDDRVTVLSLSRNFGHQVALTAGLDAARGDAVILMDSDLQHPPAMIPQMIERWRTSGDDIVSAVRRTTSDASILKRFASRSF